MWDKTFTKIYQNVAKEDIWKLWADVNNWPQWDQDLQYCQLDGDFIAGNSFVLKPKNGPKVEITLTEVEENKKFVNYCSFFGAKMYDAHYLEETQEGVSVTHILSVTGPLAFLWVRLVAKKLFAEIPSQTDNLVELARSRRD